MKTTIQTGNIYTARAHHGHRLIQVDQVRGLGSEQPYALAHEVLPSGRPASGTSRLGLPRNLQLTIYLRVQNGHAIMPEAYTLVEVEAA